MVSDDGSLEHGGLTILCLGTSMFTDEFPDLFVTLFVELGDQEGFILIEVQSDAVAQA